ncbi:MAG: hypothetical protein H5U10_18915 [Desulfacinum sp.]|jgi:hypothetical protein|nr:hypothetical protein [Desulfacinum sp.]
MRKMVGIVLVVLVGLTVSSAWAWRGQGGGWGPCWTASDPQVQAYAQEVAPLRNELYQKQLTYRQLLSNPDADPAEVGRVAREMHQLRLQIWEKAQKAGVPCGYGAGGRHGRHKGMGFGPGFYGPAAPPSQAQ